MKTLWMVALIAAAILASAAADSSAQSGSNQDNPNTPATTQERVTSHPEAASNQPWMATGEDLKGAPQRFPAGQTPE